MNVAVVGASKKPERYSYQAVKLLAEKGHVPFPVHPSLDTVDDIAVYKTVSDVPDRIDTVTVYLSARNQERLPDDILGKKTVTRVIFNPGAENPALAERLRNAGIEVMGACTLVLLRTGQF
ncbi:MAG: CoA-binding protein [Kiritimatiellae bacterium]|nr:CoA-binding protein [Kiritimatiellia bacterium]